MYKITRAFNDRNGYIFHKVYFSNFISSLYLNREMTQTFPSVCVSFR